MSRTTIQLLATLLIMALALSCGSGGDQARSDVKRIQLWHPFNAEETEVFRDIIREFEQDHLARTGEKVEVEVQYVSFGDMFTKLRTAAMADITPDVAFLDSIKVLDLAFGQALIPVSDLDSFKERYGDIPGAAQEFVPASFEAGVINRAGDVKLFGIPVQSTTVALFWNRELFRRRAQELRAAGLDPNRAPRTWDELTAYGKVLTQPERGIYAYGMYSSLWFNFPLFNMYESDFVTYDEAGRAVTVVNSPESEAALARIQQLAVSGIEGGAWKRSALGPDAGFLNQKYAMILTGPWNVESFSNAGLDFDIALNPGPSEEQIKALNLEPKDPDNASALGIQAYSSSNIGGQTGVILRSCKDPELAFQILDYFTSEKVQRRWSSTLGQIPVRRAAWKDLDMSKYPYMKVFMQQLALARRPPQVPMYGVLENDIFNPQMDLLLQNKQTPAEMLKKMEQAINDRIVTEMNNALEKIKEE
jgi:ABC-type glycerol-3-phosphate transport system substrate-binding protein